MAAVDDAMKRARAFLHDLSPRRRGETSKRASVPHDPPADPRQLVLPHVKIAAAPGTHTIRKTIWSSPAGKKHLAPRLVKLIPPHRTYVEPFAGSGAFFFAKQPSAVEVLGDADPEIAAAYKALTSLTDRELAALKEKDWIGRKSTFEGLKKTAPRSTADKLYRFLYLSRFAYGKFRGTTFNTADEGARSRAISRIERYRDRLREVKVRSAHYADVVREFDGPDTFFFLDPPYPGYNALVGEKQFDELEFRKVLDGIKGKFLATYGTRGALDTNGFHVKKLRPRRIIASMHGSAGPRRLTQLLISNYAISRKSLGSSWLDDIEGELAMTSASAADVYHAHALAKALAERTPDSSLIPPLGALVAAFDMLEPTEDESSHALARALLPITDRLSPTMRGSRSVTAALQGARPALVALAKVEPDPRASRSTADEGGRPAALERALDKRIPLLKTEDERYVLGVVLEPETVDSQNDVYSAAEVRAAAHRFLEAFGNVGLMHQGYVNDKVKIIESYLAPVDFEIAGARVKKGTWLLAVHVLDDELWELIKSGELTGLSMGGSARREEASETP
jgi:site-specific DNA-adenine methylase